MEIFAKGKTKDVYKLDNGNLAFVFKDDVTGSDGVFDPGGNEVALSIEGAGQAARELTTFFFERFNKEGLPTHYVKTHERENYIEGKPAIQFGQGLECICRYVAVGSFMRRYKSVATEGMDLGGLVEFTIKDDQTGDPLITEDALIKLGLMTKKEYDQVYQLTHQISNLIKEILEEKGLVLYDLKLEFGKDNNGQVMLIDEVSGGNMRVYKDGKSIDPLELPSYLL